jgi:hypothetical protein
MIVTAIGGKTEDEPNDITSPSIDKPLPPIEAPDDDESEELNEDDPLDRAANLAKQPLPGYMSNMTGLGNKRSQYGQEEGGKIPLKDLYETASTVKDGMLALWVDIVKESDYKFKEYLENNEDQYTRTGAVISMIVDELEDRLELEEPVGPDQGVEELKKVIKTLVKEQSKPLNEVMRQKTLNEISSMVLKEDFYGFINAGNNIMRSLEERFETRESKKYLEYLVKNNIM